MRKAIFTEITLILLAVMLITVLENLPQSRVIFEIYKYDSEAYPYEKEFYDDNWAAVITQKGNDYFIDVTYGYSRLLRSGPDGTEMEFYYPDESSNISVDKPPVYISKRLSHSDIKQIKDICRHILTHYDRGDKWIQHDGTFYYIYINGVYYQGCSGKKNSDNYSNLEMDERFVNELVPLIAKYALNEQKEDTK